MLALSDTYRDLLISGAWLVAGLILLFLGLSFLRRWIARSRQGEAEPFDLSQLRAMRDRGELTEKEYQRARETLASRLKTDRESHPQGGQTPPRT